MSDEETVPQGEPEGAEPEGEDDKTPIDVFSLLQWMIGMLHQHAWQTMGLMPSPATGKIERDLSQTKVAIDCAAYMINQVMPFSPPQAQKELRALLSDLQINFVSQSQREG
ncbi:MAG: DUF1844 domain-containing protein [Armatimonadetes bacterium]|nr:DUF1844 domain-containing protein [Armatimonadota bacterium]